MIRCRPTSARIVDLHPSHALQSCVSRCRKQSVISTNQSDRLTCILQFAPVGLLSGQRVSWTSRAVANEVVGLLAADEGLAAITGSVGLLAAALFLALWFLEKQAKAVADSQVALAKNESSDKDSRIRELQSELDKERKARGELESANKKLEQYAKDQLKLERALEIRDAQLESFMTIAQRQIALLEERLREVQKVDS